MTEQINKTPGNHLATIAHLVSDLFSPLLMPVYGMLVALWLTPMHILPLGNRLSALLGVAFITTVIPFVYILIMIRLGRISDTSISDRRQRTLPYCVTILCYIAAAIFLLTLKAPRWMCFFFVGAALVTLISMLITRSWKISAHTGGAGALAALVFWLAMRGYLTICPLAVLSAAVAIVGIMAWARLYLDRHTLAQTAAGAALSFCVETAVLLLCV
ncbi:MAG: hypothetical protein K2F79_00395 [Muribaculaceae bacterium]|nr:hypothetical protein [Muribaculaceae bacterium]